MWALQNETPFAAERTWVRDSRGAEVWIVAVKGTYTIHPDGSLQLAEKQEELRRVPVYRGEPGKSSLLYESDLVHTKVGTDVLLHGHAYAPRGEPCRQVDVRFKLGAIDRPLRVFGDRRWEKGLLGPTMSSPKPFLKMPLIYERAYGGSDRRSEDPRQHGWEPRNPVGTGFATAPALAAGQNLPNVEDPRQPVLSWQQRPVPVGFGPIARDWTPRLALAGTYDDRWFQERRPLLPLDFDNRFYNAAPEPQQLATFLRGGEAVELSNLTPNGLLRFRLPRVRIGFTTRIAHAWRHHTAHLHTVILEPDYPRMQLVWHTNLECHHDVYTLQSTRVFEKKNLRRRSDGLVPAASANE